MKQLPVVSRLLATSIAETEMAVSFRLIEKNWYKKLIGRKFLVIG